MFRLFQDAHEIIAGQGPELDPVGQAALQFRQHVAGLGDVEGAGRDKQDVFGLHRAVLGGNGGAFDQRQQVALHAFAADVGAAPLGAHGDFVDFVEKDDAVVFGSGNGLFDHLFLVQQLIALVIDQRLVGLGDRHLFRRRLLAEGLAHHVAQVEHAHLGAGHAGDVEGGHAGTAAIGNLHLHFLVVELAFAQHLAEFFPRVLAGVFADQSVDDPLLGQHLGPGVDLLAVDLAGRVDGDLDQVADDLFHITPDITDFGEFGGLDLDEGGLRQTGQAAGDLGLADAGRPDHQDIFGQHFFAHGAFQLLAPPAVAEGNGDGALGGGLADNVAVEFGDDLAGGEAAHGVLCL